MPRSALFLLLTCLVVGLTSLSTSPARSLTAEAAFDLTRAERLDPTRVHPPPPNHEWMKSLKRPFVLSQATIDRITGIPSLAAPPAQTAGELMAIALDQRYIPSDRADAIMKLGQLRTHESLNFLLDHVTLRIRGYPLLIGGDGDMALMNPCKHVLSLHAGPELLPMILKDKLGRVRSDGELTFYLILLQEMVGEYVTGLVVENELLLLSVDGTREWNLEFLRRPGRGWPVPSNLKEWRGEILYRERVGLNDFDYQKRNIDVLCGYPGLLPGRDTVAAIRKALDGDRSMRNLAAYAQLLRWVLGPEEAHALVMRELKQVQERNTEDRQPRQYNLEILHQLVAP